MTGARRLLAGTVGAAAVALTVLASAPAATAATTTRDAAAVAASWEFYSFYYTVNDCSRVGRDGVSRGWWSQYKCIFVRGDRFDLYVLR